VGIDPAKRAALEAAIQERRAANTAARGHGRGGGARRSAPAAAAAVAAAAKGGPSPPHTARGPSADDAVCIIAAEPPAPGGHKLAAPLSRAPSAAPAPAPAAAAAPLRPGDVTNSVTNDEHPKFHACGPPAEVPCAERPGRALAPRGAEPSEPGFGHEFGVSRRGACTRLVEGTHCQSRLSACSACGRSAAVAKSITPKPTHHYR
jgi:hypothetical protein